MFKKAVVKLKANKLPTLLQAFILCKVTNSKLAGKTLLISVFQCYVQAVRLFDQASSFAFATPLCSKHL